MAQLSEDELANIISRDKPGFKLVKRERSLRFEDLADAPSASPAGERVRDLQDLRRRYLGTEESGGDADDLAVADAADNDEPEDEIVVISPEQDNQDPWQPGPGPKSVVVSGKERRVVAEQG
jgi:hypothetical protein